jgi:hypothetical protein
MKLIAALLTILTVKAQALTPNVDLRDLATYSTADKLEAQQLINLISQNPTRYGVPAGLAYVNLNQIGQSAITTIEMQNETAAGADIFLIYSTNKGIWLNKVAVDVAHNPLRIETTDLTKNPVNVQIDILNRQFTLSDARTGFLKFAPVSIGSLIHQQISDPSTPYRSLSHPFAHAILSRSQSELSRTKPDYYLGRPFLRIVDLDQSEYGGFTPFGMHYQITPSLERGFISNGCFRTRDNDLYELSSMVFMSRRNGVPFSVVTSTTNGNRHPYPIIKRWFNSPRVGVDAKGKPAFLEDEHGLYIFDKIDGIVTDLLKAGGY